jgi:hypothetical protein
MPTAITIVILPPVLSAVWPVSNDLHSRAAAADLDPRFVIPRSGVSAAAPIPPLVPTRTDTYGRQKRPPQNRMRLLLSYHCPAQKPPRHAPLAIGLPKLTSQTCAVHGSGRRRRMARMTHYVPAPSAATRIDTQVEQRSQFTAPEATQIPSAHTTTAIETQCTAPHQRKNF